MNIKSLLIGAASAMTIASGAQAADAIVIADPEPIEYVRICDVYGTGFFYIPGTETCLKIGGYMRYQINFATTGIDKVARFTPTFEVRSDTEIGTLVGYAEIEINWQRGDRVANVGGVPTAVTAYGTDVNPYKVYIQILRPNGGSWLFGHTDTPYARFLGYAGPTIMDGYYGYREVGEISYTFTGSNGFSFIAALTDDEDANFIPDFELGFNFERGWGSIGAIAGIDPDAAGGFGFGAKAALVINFPNTNGSYFKLMALYTNNPASSYGFGDGAATLSALAGLNLAFTSKVSLGITAQWFNASAGAPFFAAIGLPITPVENFTITPEVFFDGTAGNAFGGLLRFQRSF